MDLKEYFDNNKGLGVLSTADKQGRVNSAVYAKPHFLEDGSLVFIMRDKLTHANIQENPVAFYLFKEQGEHYQGKRLFLKKIKESDRQDLINSIRRKCFHADVDDSQEAEKIFLVFFEVESEWPLIGAGTKPCCEC